MVRKIFIAFLFFTILIVLLSPGLVFAAAVTLDGSFEDWSDMPQLVGTGNGSDPTQDLMLVKWYADNTEGNLYFYAQRQAVGEDDKGKKFDDWNFETFIKIDGVDKKIDVSYHPPSQKVDVTLFDENGRFVWSAKGKWGEDKATGTAVEFNVPFEYLTGSIVSGYQLEVYFQSESNRLPEAGNITISTVSTFPIETSVGVLLICVSAYWVFVRRNIKSHM